MIKSKLNFFYNYFDKKKWNIGFLDYDEKFFSSNKKVNIKVLKHNYKDKWFADPFILNITKEKIHLLVEEFDEKINKGRIAKLVVNRKNLELESLKIILETKYHLSFPTIFIDSKNKIFVCPENSQLGRFLKYRYNDLLNKLDNPDLIINKPLVDTIMLSYNKNKYLFCTTKNNPSGNVLTIYIKEKHNYKLFDTVNLNEKTARSAGEFINLGDRLIRVTQDCNTSYGKGVVFQDVAIKDEKFIFNDIKRLYSNSYRYPLGLHTFNCKDNLAVVDVLGYKHFIMGNIFNFIKKLYFKLIKN